MERLIQAVYRVRLMLARAIVPPGSRVVYTDAWEKMGTTLGNCWDRNAAALARVERSGGIGRHARRLLTYTLTGTLKV